MGANPAERKFFGEPTANPVDPSLVEGLSPDENRWMSGEKMVGQDVAPPEEAAHDNDQIESMDKAA